MVWQKWPSSHCLPNCLLIREVLEDSRRQRQCGGCQGCKVIEHRCRSGWPYCSRWEISSPHGLVPRRVLKQLTWTSNCRCSLSACLGAWLHSFRRGCGQGKCLLFSSIECYNLRTFVAHFNRPNRVGIHFRERKRHRWTLSCLCRWSKSQGFPLLSY